MRDDEGLCEDCGMRSATEFYDSGAERCGPCAMAHAASQMSDAGRRQVSEPTMQEARDAIEAKFDSLLLMCSGDGRVSHIIGTLRRMVRKAFKGQSAAVRRATLAEVAKMVEGLDRRAFPVHTFDRGGNVGTGSEVCVRLADIGTALTTMEDTQ